jgi:enamine deaminase RidA (YjgF/YER057c/UK114 family)
MTIEDRLRELGLVIPPAAAPVANYTPYALSGSHLFISGQLPLSAGTLADRHRGKLGGEISEAAGREAARIAAINILAQAQAALGNLDRVRRVLRLGAYIASAPGFFELPAVMNAASDLMVDVLGDCGRHTRTTVGVAELPLGTCIEIEALLEVA